MIASGDLFLGLMSGTSMDGIDAAVVRLGNRRCEVLASQCSAYPDQVRQGLQSIRQSSDVCSIDQLGQLDTMVAVSFADSALEVLEKAQLRPEDVVAIGSHGQTIRHRPDGVAPFTMQLGDPNIIASRTGITVVADFRRRDLAVGGQGAPLTPAFHRWLLADDSTNRVVLNLGGIANITILPANETPVIGFDTGPGNTLLDAWIKRHRNVDFDDGGSWAAQGKCSAELLRALMQDSYFQTEPPKSTGFEYFNLAWLDRTLMGLSDKPTIQDVQATLVELTCRTIVDAIGQNAPHTSEVLVCGGGVHNVNLILRLSEILPGVKVYSTAQLGLDPDWVEAAAFAWLARCRLEGIPGNIPSVTGASKAVLLGGVFASGR